MNAPSVARLKAAGQPVRKYSSRTGQVVYIVELRGRVRAEVHSRLAVEPLCGSEGDQHGTSVRCRAQHGENRRFEMFPIAALAAFREE
jgi:hypothetical protein